MNARVGRNEPCPCGSGKKYKHCCLRADLARRATSQRLPGPAKPRSKRSLPSEVAHLRDTIQQSTPFLPSDQGQDLARLLDLAEEITAYEEMHDEIQAASHALEAYRAEFETALARWTCPLNSETQT